MKPGEALTKFCARDGQTVELRALKWEDLDDLLELINSLVDEGAEIVVDKKYTREQEKNWLSGVLVELESDELLHLVAEVGGRVVASSDLHRGRGSERHVGTVGIVVKKGYRGLGIGTHIMLTLAKFARKMGIELLVLSVFATNTGAQRLYRKAGYRQVGRVPKKHYRKGKYVDEIVMARLLR